MAFKALSYTEIANLPFSHSQKTQVDRFEIPFFFLPEIMIVTLYFFKCFVPSYVFFSKAARLNKSTYKE